MRWMILICLLVFVAGGAVGASADSPSPPTLPPTVVCGAAAIEQAQQAGLTVPTGAGDPGTKVCWYPETLK